MAIDLITGHQGQLHISAEQIATLNNAALNGFGDHKVLRMVDGAVSYSGLAISVGTGYWRVNGFDMEIYESENVYIDPSTIGTSRIDRVFVEILQDIPSGVQRSKLVVVMGEESANTPIAPDAPTDPELNTDLMLQCEEVCVATVTEGAMTLSDSTIAFNVVTPAELATVDTKVDNALGMIQKSSDAYSDSSPYKVGDYVIHDNKVYRCTTACVAGSWATNSGYFTETSLTTAVTSLNSALTVISTNLNKTAISVTPGNTDYTVVNNISFISNSIVYLVVRIAYGLTFPPHAKVKIGSIPSDYAPNKNIEMITAMTAGSGDIIGTASLLLETDGNIYAFASSQVSAPAFPIMCNYKI